MSSPASDHHETGRCSQTNRRTALLPAGPRATRHGWFPARCPRRRSRPRRKPCLHRRERDRERPRKTASRRPPARRPSPRCAGRAAWSQEALLRECLENGVDIPSRLGLSVRLEEANHFAAVHASSPRRGERVLRLPRPGDKCPLSRRCHSSSAAVQAVHAKPPERPAGHHGNRIGARAHKGSARGRNSGGDRPERLTFCPSPGP
jgi:hypothetical protein